MAESRPSLHSDVGDTAEDGSEGEREAWKTTCAENSLVVGYCRSPGQPHLLRLSASPGGPQGPQRVAQSGSTSRGAGFPAVAGFAAGVLGLPAAATAP